jgi:hypothetical protein
MKNKVGIAGLCLAAMGLCLGTLWYKQQSRSTQAEQSAVKTLEGLGAIVVRDANQSHVASLNMSTLQSRTDLTAALAVVKDLKWLTTLDASRTPLADEDLNIIGQIRGLTSLAFAETGISDAGVKALGQLDKLGSLNLAQTQLTSEALAALAQIKALKILNLTGTKVDRNLAVLSGLPNLEWLVLRSVNLQGDALAELAECPALHRLSLEESTYSEESVNALRSKTPTVAIDR